MKKILIVFVVLLLGLATSVSAQSKTNSTQSKTDKRLAYIIKEMKFDKATQGKIKGFIQAYLMDLKSSKDRHDAIKDKYEAAEKAGKLTNAQADELMNSKFTKDEKDLKTRRQYYARFKEIVGAAKAREIIALSNDKIKTPKK